MIDFTGRGEDMFLLVRGSIGNIRGIPSHSGELVTQVLMGEELRVLKREGGWYFVQLADGYTGWVYSWNVLSVSRTEIESWKRGANGMIVENTAVVYSGADSESPRLEELVAGTFIRFGSEENGFCDVTFPDKKRGFIAKSAIGDMHLGKVNIKRILSRAGGFIGVPYLWGGTTSRGFDCSGLIKRLFQMEGVALPRDSGLQFKVAQERGSAEIEKAAPGSLFFFREAGKICHVALSTGSGRFIHARGRVCAGSLIESDKYYDKDLAGSFFCIREIINR